MRETGEIVIGALLFLLLVGLPCQVQAKRGSSRARARNPQTATAASQPASAEEQPVVAEPGAPEQPTPLDATVLEEGGAKIGEVVIRNANVFDPDKPGENRLLFRFINRLHRRTRERVIERQLLFEPGDGFSQRRLEESARILRESDYLYDAEIRPTRYEDGLVDVEVQTRDVWSLKGGVGFGRSGGTNSVRFGIEDENFLGLGKSLAFKHTSNVDRTSSLFRYRDPNVLGHRMQAELAYSDNSDGQLMRVSLGRPFFSLDTRWAVGVRAWTDDRVDPLYLLGQVSRRFGHQERYAEGWVGFSHGLRKGRTRRWRGGISFDDHGFAPAVDEPVPVTLPPDHRRVYPWVELETVADGYIVVHDLDKIERSEDRNLGQRYAVRLGLASRSFGADRDQALVDASYSSALRPGDRQFLFFDARASGWFGSDRTDDVRIGGGMRYYLRDFRQNVLFAGFLVDATQNLAPESQLLLGGDSGLRGYPLRYQNGDRRVLFTLEQRFFTDWHLFKMIRVGAAAFVDVGRAWFADAPGFDSAGWLSDVGVGLRLGSSRTSSGSMVHIDLAMPLDGGNEISGLQLLVRTRETF